MKSNILYIVTIGRDQAWYLVDAPSISDAMGLADATSRGANLPASSRCLSMTHPEAGHFLDNLINKSFLGKLTLVPLPYHIEDTDRVCDAKGTLVADCAGEENAKLILQALLAYKP